VGTLKNPGCLRDMKPCPFCGGKPKVHQWYFGAFVYCTDCKSKGPEINSDHRKRENLTSLTSKAMIMWDKRTANCCAEGVEKVTKNDGDMWKCKECGSWWQYVEDEAEGGAWHRRLRRMKL